MTSFPSEMGPLELDVAVDGYIRYTRALREQDRKASRDPEARLDAVAGDAITTAIDTGHAGDAWRAVLEILRRSSDEELGYFAAGPLEDLVRTRGAELIGSIEDEAARDARFRWALGCIWLTRGVLPDDVLDRVVRASGGVIEPFGVPEAKPPGRKKKRKHR